MNDNFKNAFTLVELLVVIAIVGILSGLIIVGMNSSTQSATIAKAQIFSASLRDSMLGSLVAEWKFDGTGVSDGSNATTAYTQDSWSSNNCTINGTPTVYSASNCIYGSCLKYNGSTDYLDCGNASSLNISGAKTISVWVKFNAFPTVSGNGQGIVSNKNYWILVYAKSYGIIFYDKSTTTRLNSGEILNLNTWYNIVATSVDSNYANQKLYINGTNIAGNYQYNYGGPTLTNLLIGYKGADTQDFFNGLIDEVRIYNTTMPTSEIKLQYYAGINRLLSIGDFNREEYINRINEI